MKKRNMLFAGIVSAIVIMSSVSLHAMAEENVVFTYDFDNLVDAEIVAGGETTVESINNDVLTFSCGQNAEIKIGEAKTGKTSGTSQTLEGETDKDIFLRNSLSNIQNAQMHVNLPTNAETEQNIDISKDIKISFNLSASRTYTTTHDLGYVAICDGAGNKIKVLDYSGIKGKSGLVIRTFVNKVQKGDISTAWHYYDVILHTNTRTFDIYRNGAEVSLANSIEDDFILDPNSEEKFNSILFATNSTINKTTEAGDVMRIDDITVSEIDQAPAITEFAVSAPEICVNDTAVSQITVGTAAVGKVHVEVPANLEEAKNVTLIGALYDGNKLVQAYTDGTKTYPAGGAMLEEDITLNMPLTEAEAGYTVKLFVWDTAVNMLPISQIVPTATIVE